MSGSDPVTSVGRRARPPAHAEADTDDVGSVAPVSEAGFVLKEAANRQADPFSERFVITAVSPQVDGGRYPVKRVVGEAMEVTADIVADGHAVIAAQVIHRQQGTSDWTAVPMRFVDNDRWSASIAFETNARHEYTVEAWIDAFASWRRDLLKRVAASQDVGADLDEGRALVERARQGAGDAADGKTALAVLDRALEAFDAAGEASARTEAMLDEELAATMARVGPRLGETRRQPALEAVVDPVRARTAAWYEMFWRSQGTDATRSATVDECIARLPYIRDMGFDVVYLVPIHPIGRINRKGRNNALVSGPHDPGSPYAIGSEAGGHRSVNPDWGTLEDFRRFVAAANEHGLEVALDFAIQCSPDHPWVAEHPDWFRWRSDGSIKFAENPPKKYEDIVNVEFYDADGQPIWGLWRELKDTILFWIDQGVKTFRVDNPHTKPLPFWEWVIGEVQARHPDTIFLAEAFTRPKLMAALAKLGFTQSYSYFTWRVTRDEMRGYAEELTQGPARWYMRANFFANTPDILPFHLQEGGRPAFMQRAVLAATLSSVYGIYNGFELCENRPVPGKEEYLGSEKYEYKVWDWERPGHIRGWITAINRIRRENPALQLYDNLEFYESTDENILVYGKFTPDRSNAVLVAVNMDPHAPHEGMIEIPLWRFGLPDWDPLHMEELVSGHRFTWEGKMQHVWIDNHRPAFIWRMSPVRA